MSTKEGMRRLVRLISFVAALWLIGTVLLAVVSLSGSRPDTFIVWSLLVGGVAGFSIINAVAWVISGFCGIEGTKRLVLPRWSKKTRVSEPEQVNPGPVGMGGWLSLLVLLLIIFRPLASAGQTSLNIDEVERILPGVLAVSEWIIYKRAVWFLIATQCAISISAGYKLWKDYTPQSVVFAMWALWLCGPAVLVIDFFLTVNILGESIKGAAIDMAGLFIGNIVGAAGWTAYLKWSRRVRNTYYKRLY